jgi:hypothetical protein
VFVPCCAQTMESMVGVCATVRKDGKDQSVTSQNMTVKFQTALGMGSALPVFVSVSRAGKAHSVSMVSTDTFWFLRILQNVAQEEYKSRINLIFCLYICKGCHNGTIYFFQLNCIICASWLVCFLSGHLSQHLTIVIILPSELEFIWQQDFTPLFLHDRCDSFITYYFLFPVIFLI